MPFKNILSDSRISPTDKLVAIALLSIEGDEIRHTNKEIAAMISSVETVVNRSIKALVSAGIIQTKLENNSKRIILTLDNNARLRTKNGRLPLANTQAPLTITQGYRLHPLIKLLTPLSKYASPLNNNARGVSKYARVNKVVPFDNQDFIKCNPYFFSKKKSSAYIYKLFINYKVSINYKLLLKKYICRQKEKPKPKAFEMTFDESGVGNSRRLINSVFPCWLQTFNP